MGQWNKSLYFTFDNVDSRKYKLAMLDVKEDGEVVKFGLDRDVIEEENSLSDTPFFVRVKNKSVEIKMELVKCSDSLIPQTFNDKELRDIRRWLFKNKFRPLVVEGKCYHVIFEKMGEKKEYGSSRQGYLTLTARIQDGYSHKKYVLTSSPNVKGEKIEELQNTSDVDKITYLNMNITQLSDTKEDIKIKNLSNGDEIVVKNVAKNDNFVILSRDMEIYNLKNEEDDTMFNNTTYNNHFITLRYGKNRIKCTGNFKITFSFDVLGQL